MSSNEDKTLIKFPGSKKELNQGLQQNRTLGKENEYGDNLIPFPGTNKKELLSVGGEQDWDGNIRAKQETSLSVIDRTDTEFWKQSSLKFDSSSNKPSIGDQKSSDPMRERSSRGDGKNSNKKSYYAFSSVACALCLMLIGVPFYNQQSQRGLASISPVNILKGDGQKYEVYLYENEDRDLTVKLREYESGSKKPRFLATPKGAEKLKKKLNRQEETILNLIKTGQRTIASIGQKPAIKDRFFMETLKSRYNVQWYRGKLSSASLLDGQEPVVLPSVDNVVKEYRSLFPHYATIRKKDNSSDHLEIYELRNRENIIVKRVETARDEQGRLLSIYVMSD